MRGLEKGELCCVLLSSEITTSLISKMIWAHCKAYCVPALLISELKAVSYATLGFPTMVLGLKKVIASSENKFYPIYEIVSKSAFDVKPTLKFEDTKLPSNTKFQDNNSSITKISSKSSKPSDLTENYVLSLKDIYLYRERRDERKFKPTIGLKNKEAKIKHSVKGGIEEDFITLVKSESKPSLLVKAATLNSTNQIQEDVDSDADSIDEDNMFFVDNKPDQSLMEWENSGIRDIEPHEFEGNQAKDIGNIENNTTKQNIKAENGKSLMNTSFKNKMKMKSKQKIFHQKKSGEVKCYENFSSKYRPMRIKTVLSNPQKSERKIKKRNSN